MTISGKRYTSDLKIINGQVFPDWWREKGHLIEECDVLRSRLDDALPDIHERLSLDVIFTANKRWT